jgi:putative flippase GtrA
MVSIQNKQQKLRFAVVGAANTVIDFSIFLGLSSIGMPPIAANFIATTTALCFSFVANKKYTFSSNSTSVKKEITLFLAVTLIGLWVLQPLVLTVVSRSLVSFSLAHFAVLVIAKFAATLVTLVWNYILYSRVVFKDPHTNNYV